MSVRFFHLLHGPCWLTQTTSLRFPKLVSAGGAVHTAQDEHRSVSHTFSAGYRAQCRFRSGPLFEHPAVATLDYLMSLDTDSMFPREVNWDPIEAMHGNGSRVLGYSSLLVSSSAYVRGLWPAVLQFLAYEGLDLRQGRAPEHFLRRFLVDQPGSDYFRFYRFIDELGGFWLYRWGDHAIRGLGTAIALWAHEAEEPRLLAYDLEVPYAHQATCFCHDPQLRCVDAGKDIRGRRQVSCFGLRRRRSGTARPPDLRREECRAPSTTVNSADFCATCRQLDAEGTNDLLDTVLEQYTAWQGLETGKFKDDYKDDDKDEEEKVPPEAAPSRVEQRFTAEELEQARKEVDAMLDADDTVTGYSVSGPLTIHGVATTDTVPTSSAPSAPAASAGGPAATASNAAPATDHVVQATETALGAGGPRRCWSRRGDPERCRA
eukprot:g10850.t1